MVQQIKRHSLFSKAVLISLINMATNLPCLPRSSSLKSVLNSFVRSIHTGASICSYTESGTLRWTFYRRHHISTNDLLRYSLVMPLNIFQHLLLIIYSSFTQYCIEYPDQLAAYSYYRLFPL